MKRLTATFTAFVLALAAFVAPSWAQAVVAINESMPIAIDVFIPCANGGAGEVVTITGNLHVLIHETIDRNGGYHFDILLQPQGVSGIGATTGAKYQGTGETSSRMNQRGPAPFEASFVNNFRIIGQGRGNNFLIHENLHITVNANGELTVFQDNFSADCK